ncbi:hypothetical protein HXX76_009211 [Chlamydomonas incerta]|uniref:peptidylprolyl isomerase n=1 Tax=Chlamydomonas incerta TaxID=51695 RepID=A0A835VW94_CHLIN|nr:hypothetical protein HXX76_009211 [Chlamydomonas incerta]|eukprot:KAG2431712.1 hypothetical protein HXX76_009211 [Chlamydomonas incerta]
MQALSAPSACGVQARVVHRLAPAPFTKGCSQRGCRLSTTARSYGPSSSGDPAPADSILSRRHALALLPGAALVLGLEAAGPGARGAQAKVSIAEVVKGNGKAERDIQVTASGIRMSLVSSGRGDAPATGALVLVDVVGQLEDGTVFLDTRVEGAAPLAFQLGTTNKYVTEGLEQVVQTMKSGDVKLAVVPPSLGYGARGVTFKSGQRVPPNAPLYYEVSLLRCQTFNLGLACCADADFPCIKKPEAELTMTSLAPKQ